MLIGWAGLLVPALIRSIEERFSQSDAGLGAYYFVLAVFYALGSLGGGFLTERVGRRVVLSGSAILIGIGLALQAVAPSWVLFVAAGIPAGIGSGSIDGGMNGLVLAVSRQRPGGAMNALHLFFSVGALASPFVVGRLVAGGVPWQDVLVATAVVAIAIGVLLAIQAMPSGRPVAPRSASSPSVSSPSAARSVGRRQDLRATLPLIALAASIATYVASEIGVSSWLVRFLTSATLETATTALAIFWGGLTLGRLLSVRVADRLPPVVFAAACAVAAGASLVAAVLVPDPTASIALFGLVGLAYGPIYPLIMTVAGALYPNRLAAVTGALAAAAVVGAVVYPPLIGLLSGSVGIGVGLLGAAGLSLLCAVALAGAWLSARARR
ncbi:MAG TPA: MFS transporter [Candidatus Eisenbacteria bacterium]|nr:MFS transporter [Candidatus Eisenbacteria bacterium]